MEPHAVEEGDSCLGLKGQAVIERAEVAVDLLGAGELRTEATDHHDRELQAFCLVDSHHLHMSLREGLVRVFIFVNPALMQQP